MWNSACGFVVSYRLAEYNAPVTLVPSCALPSSPYQFITCEDVVGNNACGFDVVDFGQHKSGNSPNEFVTN